MSCPTDPIAPDAPETFGTPSLALRHEKVLEGVDPEVISATHIYFQKAEFFGFKGWTSDAPDTNTAEVMIGFDNEKFMRVLQPGESIVIEAPAGQKFDLGSMYVKGTNPDGVMVEYS